MPNTQYHLILTGDVGGYNFDIDTVRAVLAENAGKPVQVFIDSLGGWLNVGLSVCNAFREHGDVHVHMSGMNASAATVAAMGAKTVTMDANSFYLVHKAMFTMDAFGAYNADDFESLRRYCEEQKETLDKFDLAVAELYAARCKKTPAQLIEQMTKGNWLSAKEAQEWGFVDEVTGDAAEPVNDLTARDLAVMSFYGIPELNATTQPRNGDTILARLIQRVASMFSAQAPQTSRTGAQHGEGEQQAAEGEPLTSRTSAQHGESAQHSAAADATAADLEQARQTIAQLREQIAQMQATEPGDTTSQVVTTGEPTAQAADRFATFMANYRDAIRNS